jgi:hypothetical protein
MKILQLLNMKTIVVLVSLVLFGSCQKVIQLDLKDAATYMVIEGEVNADDSVHTVRLSNSKSFSSDNVFEAITGATVVLSDDLNNSEVLTEVESGVYKTINFKAIEGRTYYLEVTSNGKKYTANSTIPHRVVLDSMSFIPDGLSSKGGLIPIPKRFDPAGVKNSYRFEMYVKRIDDKDNLGWYRDSAILIQNDDFADGVETNQPLFGNIGDFYVGDSCRVTMMCIDESIYKYFYSLTLNGPGGAATPANPVSNIVGENVLGYFSAQTKQTIELEVK